jgi:hypothetical protein
MLAVDFFHFDRALTLRRLYVPFALKVGDRSCTCWASPDIPTDRGPPSMPATC